MKNFLKKLVLLGVSIVFVSSFATTAFAAANSQYFQYDGNGVDSFASGYNPVQVGQYTVDEKCTKLAGLTKNFCKVRVVGTTACAEPAIVCNVKDIKVNADSNGVILESESDWQTASSAGVSLYKKGEKNDYCNLPDKNCAGEPVEYTAADQEHFNRSWDLLNSGDLGGFLCEQAAGGTHGFFGCEDSGNGDGQTFILPVEETTFTQFSGDFAAPDTAGYSPGLTENKGIREFVLNIVNFVLGFLGLAAVIAIIYGGFIYVTAGGDDSKTEKGKNSVLYAIIGIMLILASYAIVRTVICFAPVGGDDQASFCRVSGGGTVQSAGQINLSEDVGATVTTTYESAHDRLREIGDGVLNVSTSYLNITSAADYLPTIEYALQSGIDEAMRVLVTLQKEANGFAASTSDINEMMSYLSRQRPLAKATTLLARALYTDLLVVGQPLLPSSFEDAYEFMDAYSQQLKVSAQIDYEENIDKYIRYAEGLEDLFTDMGSDSRIGRSGVKGEMTDVKDALNLLRVQRADRDELTNLVKQINEAAEVVKNLEFVKIKLNVSTRQCTAPCIALFDSIGSVDPSGQTIFDPQHSWDLDGDGRFYETSVDCNEQKLATVSCVYNDPGTYVVTLKVNSSQPEKYASGIATTRIEVKRPLAKVKVKISSSDGVEVLAMDNTATPAIRNGRTKFTLEEAKAGLTFNATGSLGSSNAPITEFVWSFGSDQFSGSNASKNYSYSKEGSYKVILEVVENGLSERVVIPVEIGSPSSNFIIQNPQSGAFHTGQTISFDGSYSKSDNGAVTDYTWSILKDGNAVSENSSATSTWSFVPTAPGEYRVVLQITDAVGESDINETTFLVESQKPTACFTYAFEDDTQPGTAHLHNCSTDPDEADVLAYNWTVSNADFIDDTDATSMDPVIKFNKNDSQKITLDVNDQYLDDNLRQEDSIEKQVQVASVLDISMDVPNGIAYQLSEDTGTADVEFSLQSDNAVSFEIDYDDGYNEPATTIGSASFTHTYTQSGVYKVKATVIGLKNETNYMTKKIFIGAAGSPLPVLDLQINNQSIDASGETVEVPRKTSITFDTSDSLNTDGTSKKLISLIKYGDGTVSSNKVSNHIYEDAGIYKVTFTVTDEQSGISSEKVELTLDVIDSPPIIHSLSSSIVSGSLETPVDISVTVDAEDKDGIINQYTWTMFDQADDQNILETQVSNTARATFTFHGLGTTGQDHKVGFCIKVKDDGDNETDSCIDDGAKTFVDTITGQNAPPKAKFSVGDSQVQVGDPVIFYDESTDDNEITEIYYDVLGNGFADDEVQTEHSFSHIYDKVGKYPTRLKVYDANGASNVYGPVDVIVESSVKRPTAKIQYEVDNLKVSFKDDSDIGEGTTLDKRIWDFDLDNDSDGDGVNDNDVDSTDEHPEYTYSKADKYRVGLTVIDMQGNEDSVVKMVEAISEPLTAKLVLTPVPDVFGVVHLQGNQAEVRADVTQSTGPIVRYVIEQNIGFDPNYDYSDGRQGLFVYDRSWKQPFTMRLTVYDADGNKKSDAKRIIFDPIDTP